MRKRTAACLVKYSGALDARLGLHLNYPVLRGQNLEDGETEADHAGTALETASTARVLNDSSRNTGLEASQQSHQDQTRGRWLPDPSDTIYSLLWLVFPYP